MVFVNGNSNMETNIQGPVVVNSPVDVPFSQTVGREFVRQYYTMFGSGPKYVHRFYGNESLFVRDDVVVVGQSMIEKQIEKLNLKDCHTKIRCVDAHETIANGVVIQVSLLFCGFNRKLA